MKRVSIIMSLIFITSTLTACVNDSSVLTPTTDTNQKATFVAATLSASLPTEDLVESAITPFPGIPVSFEYLHFVLPPTVASGSTGIKVPSSEGTEFPPWEISPEHIQLDLDTYILQNTWLQPQIFVYPAEEYAILQPTIAENITHLQEVLDNPGKPLTDDVLPTYHINAVQLFTSNKKIVPFQNGLGIRLLTQIAQDPVAINNHDLIYFFSGLTSDGQYYVVAILPINAPGLPENYQSGEFPDPNDPTNAENALQEYYSNVTLLLNNTHGDSFTPNINLLDTLINSVNIVE
jgi:hypothetical protein